MTKYFCFFSQKEYFLPHNSCVYAKKAVLLQPISSRDGGIGRHEGLKILWPVMAVRVQVPLAVQKKKVLNMKMLGTFAFLNSNRSLGRK